jgi:AraC-like DNA-binding protein
MGPRPDKTQTQARAPQRSRERRAGRRAGPHDAAHAGADLAPTAAEDRALRPATVRAWQVRPLIDMASARGVRVNDMLRGFGLPRDLLNDPDAPILLADYYRIQHQISAALEDETCKLSTRQLLPGTTDFILSHVAGVQSLLEAMKIIARSYNLVHGGEFNAVRARGDVVSFIIDDRGFPYAIRDNPDYIAFSLECVQIFLHCMLRIIAPEIVDRALRKVSVTRARREAGSEHLACWPAPVRYGAPVYAIEYDATLSRARIVAPHAEALTAARVHSEIIAMADRGATGGPHLGTVDFVRSALSRGVIDQTRIAALLGVSAATLRRRLETEGANFRDLRRDVLNAAAKSLLARRRPVAEVAEELGFSEFRSFNRAFKAWNGMTPKAFAAAVRKAI